MKTSCIYAVICNNCKHIAMVCYFPWAICKDGFKVLSFGKKYKYKHVYSTIVKHNILGIEARRISCISLCMGRLHQQNLRYQLLISDQL